MKLKNVIKTDLHFWRKKW